MTRIICVTSGKGGVGKTTLVSNLSAALAELGQEVIAVDANLTTPNLGLHFGYHLAQKTLHDVLKGKAKLDEAIYSHPFGFKVLPASMAIADLQSVDVARLSSAALGLVGKANFVLMDSAAGLGREATSAMNAADEVLIVTNPDLPAVTDALKIAKISERSGKEVLGIVLNRVSGKWHEMLDSDVEEAIGHPIVAKIPEDRNVAKAIALKMPVIHFDPYSNASIEIHRLAHRLVGKEFNYEKPIHKTLIEALVGWMNR